MDSVPVFFTAGFHAADRTDREWPPSSFECRAKLRNEYTRTVLSEVAVAMRGKPLGFGIETQALEAAAGLNSARGRMRRDVGEAILVGREKKLGGYTQMEEENKIVVVRRGTFFFRVGVLIRLCEIAGVHGPMLLNKRLDSRMSFIVHIFTCSSMSLERL